MGNFQIKKKQEPRVFVMEKQGKYDISAVKYYSKNIIYIADQECISPFDTFPFVELVVHKLRMAKFDAQKDFICLTGSSVLLSLFLAAIIREFNLEDVFKILIYDARNNKYNLRLLNFPQ